MRRVIMAAVAATIGGFLWAQFGIAHGADLPRKALAAPALIVTTNPFYIGIFGGAGFSKTQNELTFDGVPQGPVSAFPTGLLAGVTVGSANNSGPSYFGAAVEAAYDFSRGDVQTIPTSTGAAPIASRKNGLLLQEGVEIGISLTTLGGYIPSSAQPSNWPVPITVPSSVWSNLILAGRGGLPQPDVTLCAFHCMFHPISGNPNVPCASKFINGPYAGAEIKAMLSAQSEVVFEYDHVFWNSSFTPAKATALFSSTIAAKNEDLFKLKYNYHF